MSESKGIRVFVYGTLKKDQSNHPLMTDPSTAFLGRHIITGAFEMHNFGHFPGVIRLADAKIVNPIYGEVYRISEDTLEALDALEGNGSFYTRDQIQTPWKKAWCYFAPQSAAKYPLVSSGLWKPTPDEQAWVNEQLKKVSEGGK